MAARRKKHLPELSPLEAKVMEILEFVKSDQVDPIYLEASYYVAPDEGGEKAYALLFTALKDSGYYGVAKVAMHNREQERKRFIFRAAVERPTAAAAVARRIVKSICGGAVESLLIGMVESRMLSRKELDAARKRLAQLESEARDD